MAQAILRHSAFWFLYVALYVIRSMLFAGPTDLAYPFWERLLRFFFSELSFLPWKAVPFYLLFYFLIPRFFNRGAYFKTALYFVIVLVVCLFGYRSMIGPVSKIMYGESPDFNVYSVRRLIFTLTDLLPAIGLASTVKLLKASILSRRKEAALQEQKRAAELNFLKAQTNPHFLFNTLNNLYGLARRNDPNAAASILKLSNIMRYILRECDSVSIPIEREIDLIRDYLELEQLRYDERLRVDFRVEVDDLRAPVPPLILLPFVENAFKHGVSETRLDTFVDIRLEVLESRLGFFVNNSFDPDEVSRGQGTGLHNVRRQLELIYGDHYSLRVEPGETVFAVELLIHLNPDHG